MKRTLMMTAAICALSTTICALSLPALAHSGGPSRSDPSGPSQTMTGQQSQGQAQGQAQGQIQSQIARGGNASARATGGSATGGQGGAGGQGGQGGRSTATNTVNVDAGNGGGGYGTRSNTPDAIAPAIVGGGVCTVGASGALSLAGIGLAGGATAEGENCVRRQNAALLMNMGLRSEAVAILCADTNFSNAFAEAGHPCAADVRRWQAQGYRQVRRADGVVFWAR